jgi:hypothetical protein
MSPTDIDMPLVMRIITDILEHEQTPEALHVKLTTDADYARLFLPDSGLLDLIHKMTIQVKFFIENNLRQQRFLQQEAAQEKALEKLQQELRKWKYKLPFWQAKKRQLKAQWDKLMNTDTSLVEFHPVPLTLERFGGLTITLIELMTAQPPQRKQVDNLAEDIKQFMVAKLFSREFLQPQAISF